MTEEQRERKIIPQIVVDEEHRGAIDEAHKIQETMNKENGKLGQTGSNAAMVASCMYGLAELSHELLHELKAVAEKSNVVIAASLDVKQNNLVTQVQRLSLEDQLTQKKRKGVLIKKTDLITELYDFTACINDVVKESELKVIRGFDGIDKKDSVLEDFLESVVSLGKAQKLTESGIKTVIWKKLEGSARSTTKGMLFLRNTSIEDIPLRDFLFLLEQEYMPHSDKRSALLALERIPKLRASTGYQQLSGEIIRFAKLSVRDLEEEAEKELILQTRASQTFLNTILSADREKIISENSRRLEKGELDLSLAEQVQFLTKLSHDSLRSKNKPLVSPLDNVTSSVKLMRPDQFLEGAEQSDENNILFLQGDGRSRGRNNRGQFGNNRFQGQGQGYKDPRQQYRGGQRGEFRGKFPSRGQGTWRGNFGPQVAQGQGPRGQGQRWPTRDNNNFPPQGRGGRVRMDAEKLGIRQGHCWACAKGNHKAGDISCPYRGLQLNTFPCPACFQGGHSQRDCLYTQPGPGQRGGQNQGQGRQRGRGERGEGAKRPFSNQRPQNNTAWRARGKPQYGPRKVRPLKQQDGADEEEGNLETEDGWFDWAEYEETQDMEGEMADF